MVELNIIVQNSSKTTKKFFTFDVLTSIRGLHQKKLVYRKPTHTDQYLNFMSPHPIDHKIRVVRTLLERSQNLVSKPEGKKRKISMFKMPFRRVATQSGHFRRPDAR